MACVIRGGSAAPVDGGGGAVRCAGADAESWAARDDRAVTCRNEPVCRAERGGVGVGARCAGCAPARGFERAWRGWNIAAMLVCDEPAARFGMEEVPPSERNSLPLVARLWPALIFGEGSFVGWVSTTCCSLTGEEVEVLAAFATGGSRRATSFLLWSVYTLNHVFYVLYKVVRTSPFSL